MARIFTNARAAGVSLWAILVLLGVSVPGASAQELTGTLYGKITAEDGSVLPGATITITSPQLIRGTDVQVTGQDGTYRVSGLPPGTYAVQVELAGFQPVKHADLTLAAGAAVPVDVTLKISQIN